MGPKKKGAKKADGGGDDDFDAILAEVGIVLPPAAPVEATTAVVPPVEETKKSESNTGGGDKIMYSSDGINWTNSGTYQLFFIESCSWVPYKNSLNRGALLCTMNYANSKRLLYIDVSNASPVLSSVSATRSVVMPIFSL